MTEEQDDGIIELTEITEEKSLTDDAVDLEDDGIIELTDIEPDAPVGDNDLNVDDVSSAQLEAAIEKIIEKKFSGTIETLLFQVMERVIEKEIKEIRESLQKDLDQIGNT